MVWDGYAPMPRDMHAAMMWVQYSPIVCDGYAAIV